jgi:uncharacterized protein YwqG
MDSPQQVRALLIQHGLADKADDLMALARPSIRIFTQPADDATIPVGASKIGGAPDLPPDFVWPIWEHELSDDMAAIWTRYNNPLPEKIRPLGFLAQFNLAEVALYDFQHRLPATGMLYFFYDGVEQPWVEAVRDGGAQIIYHPGTAVQRAPAPTNLPNESRFEPCRVTLKQELTLPSLFSLYVERPYSNRNIYPDAVHLSKQEADAYEAVQEAITEDSKTTWSTNHRLLGYPQPVQDAVEVDCEVCTSGIYFDGEFGDRQRAVIQNARRWRLLFQLDSDDFSNMMWGDVGKLYFCLPHDALAAQRFEEGVMILQCH